MPSLFESLGGLEDWSDRFEKAEILNRVRLSESTLKEIAPNIEPELISEATFDSQQVHDLAKNDMDFFGALAMPLIFKYCFPPVFKSVWQWLLVYVNKQRDFSQLALGLPRGFGKTIVVKLFVLYCILFTSKKFILILAENQTKANNILSDIIDMLEEENIRKVFGAWNIGVETDRQDLKKFGYRGRNIILMAGTVEVIRGISLKNERPDVMIFDDIQSRVMAESEIVSNTLEREMVGTAMKAKSPHGCLFIFVGNMYPTKWSLLRRLKTNPNWIKFIAGGILSDGTSLWEELQPLEQLMREFDNDLQAGRPEIFYSEVLNDENASSNNFIDFSKIPEYSIPEDELCQGNFILIDPSGYKKNSDDVAVGYFDLHSTNYSAGIPVLKEVKSAKMSPGDAIKIALEFALKYGCRLIVIESVAYQSTFAYWLDFICKQLGIVGIEAVEIYPGGHSKNSRILAAFKQYMAGELMIHPDCRPEVHLQITQFNPLKSNNTDDILDLLAYATKVVEMYGAYIISLGVLISQESSGDKVLDFNSPF